MISIPALSYSDSIVAAQTLVKGGDIVEAEKLSAQLCESFPAQSGAFALHARCAALRSDWQEAVHRWNKCQELFPDEPDQWAYGLATALRNLGETENAEKAYFKAVAAAPDNLNVRAALASLVTGSGNPGKAIGMWREIKRRDPEGKQAPWRLGLARAHIAAGQPKLAKEALLELLESEPDHPQGSALYLRLLTTLGWRDDAVDALADGVFSSPRGENMMLKRLRAQIFVWDVPAARGSFEDLFWRTRDIAMLAVLFEMIPRIFETWDRTRFWIETRKRLADPALFEQEDASVATLRMRATIALRDYSTFLADHVRSAPVDEPWATRFSRLSEVLGGERFPDLGRPRVFGIGLSRTATTTLAAALERLGYLTAHFTNTFSGEALEDEDFHLFDAATDIPVCLRLEMLFHMFPNARFILTYRNLAEWERSLETLFWRSHGSVDFRDRAERQGAGDMDRWGTGTAAAETALYFNHKTPRAAHEAYMRRVDSLFVGPHRKKLLLFDASAGDEWFKLCKFLKCDVPPEPFPWKNRTPAVEDVILS